MNVFASGPRHQPWVWQVTGLCFILGLLLAGSYNISSSLRLAGNRRRPGAPSPVSTLDRVDTQKLQKEIDVLRKQNTKLEETLGQGDKAGKMLNDELQKMKRLAGLTELRGSGIILTLQDSKVGPPSNRQFERPNYIIHDFTIQQAINELNASGAEAISINGQRIIGRTPIRCVGPTAQVNGVPIGSPFVITAIGDPKTMDSGLNLRDGYLDSIRSFDPAMCKLEQKKQVIVPAYTGSTDIRYAHPAPEEKASSTDKSDKASKPEKDDGDPKEQAHL